MKSRTTLWREKKGLSPILGSAYHQKKMAPGQPQGFQVEDLERMAYKVASNYLLALGLPLDHALCGIEDLVQASLLRIYEIGTLVPSHPMDGKRYIFRVFKNACRSYVQANLKGGEVNT